ncbi:DUF1376 domain-containing protein [Moraxella nonliquefaciens]|uniref:DUF1376 domain-containing protein n=1 Tax=Moraxella nonliquefaciens TaxID=478 RepID=UPI0024A6DFF1|nr:DUF1376 domain-containing protein [Moraxella nonliquefaciens]MDI4498754.1 DUF1376 domain-containing protein [Moraxella nonliquefaciens]MDI4500554.1 DUF1376 domain-containing protein [Moraxella nonliquefaciens]
MNELKKIHYMTHNFSDFDSETKHMTRNQRAIYLDLRTLYFTTAHKNNGAIGDDLALLYFRLDCHSDSDKADVDWLLKDKFKKIGRTYRHADWDKQIKDIRFAMRHASNADTKSNTKSNDDRNTHIYDNTGGFVMTGAERTEKSRKLKALKNKGVQADKSMSLNVVRELYDSIFHACDTAHDDGCNVTDNPCNVDGNASNAQIRENNHNPLNHNPLNHESATKTPQTSHAHTHTRFYQKLPINQWQVPTVAVVNERLRQEKHAPISEQALSAHVIKFKNYYTSREVQGNYLATEQVRMDKLVAWIIREKPTFAPTSEITSNGGHDGSYADYIAKMQAENKAYNESIRR